MSTTTLANGHIDEVSPSSPLSPLSPSTLLPMGRRLMPHDLSPTFTRAAEDYGCVRRALAFLSEHWRDQPDVAAIADAAGLSPDALTVLFRRWAGLTPKAFL